MDGGPEARVKMAKTDPEDAYLTIPVTKEHHCLLYVFRYDQEIGHNFSVSHSSPALHCTLCILKLKIITSTNGDPPDYVSK